MKQYPAWGVDLTPVSLRGVELMLTPEGRPRVVGWDVVDYTEQLEDVTSIARFGLMARGVYHFRKNHKLQSSRVWASLRSETAFVRSVVVPPVNDESLDKILEYEAQQQVPFPLDEVYWDRRVISIREDGEVLATLYAVRKSMVEDRMRKLAKSGLPVDGFQLRPLALQNFCAYERLLSHGTVVVDVDYNGLQILIHHDDQTWFRVLPIGGVDFVNLVTQSLQVPHATAVRYIGGELTPPDPKRVATLRSKVAQDLAGEVSRTVRYYVAVREGLKLERVVLFQSHRCVPDIEKTLAQELKLPITIPRGFHHIEVDPRVVGVGIQENFASLAKAAGLALQGVGKAEVEARLFPAEVERELSGRKIGYVLAGLLLMTLVAVASFRMQRNLNELVEARSSTTTALANTQSESEIVKLVRPDEADQHFDELTKPSRGQHRQTEIMERLLYQRAQWGAITIPVASVDTGAEAKIVLAVEETGTEAESLRALDAAAKSLVDETWILSATPSEHWVARQASSKPEANSSSEPLRFRFRHRRYVLSLKGKAR